MDYCLERGLALSSFDYWSARIRKQQKGLNEKLVRIGVVEKPANNDTGGPFVLFIGDQYRQEIPSPVNQGDVKKIIDILGTH